MSKTTKRKSAVQRSSPSLSAPSGPSNQVLAGLGVALLVVVLVVLLAGGGLTQPASPAGGGKAAPTAAAPALDTARVGKLEDALKTNPNDKAALIELGNLYYDADRFSEAISWYAKALELDPNNTDVRTDMATAYYYTGDVNRAIEEGRKVLAVDPNKVQARLNMGIWLISQTPPNTTEAIQNWQVVVNLYPGSDSAQQAQALIDKYKK